MLDTLLINMLQDCRHMVLVIRLLRSPHNQQYRPPHTSQTQTSTVLDHKRGAESDLDGLVYLGCLVMGERHNYRGDCSGNSH